MTTPRRFFIEDLSEGLKTVNIEGDEFRHLKNVLRKKVGAEVSLFNGRGVEVFGVVKEIGKSVATIRVEGSTPPSGASPVEITLLQGLTKGDKAEFITQKATELGAASVGFFTSERSVPELKDERVERKTERLKRATVEAAKQCGLSYLPEILPFTDFESAIKGHGDKLKIIFYEEEVAKTIKDFLKGLSKISSVVILVGPEGGFESSEVEAAKKEGFVSVGLGPRLLRAETAALTALAIIQYELGGLG